MDLVRFHVIRTGVQSNADPGDDIVLDAMKAQLAEALAATGCFDEIEVDVTDNPDQLVIGLCQYKPDLDEDAVAAKLEQVWLEQVAYPFWEAHAVFVDADHVEFEAATRLSSFGHYVTVHLVGQKSLIPAQRSAYDDVVDARPLTALP